MHDRHHAVWLTRTLSGSQIEDGDLVLVDSGLDCDTFNVVIRARLDPD